MNQTLFMNDPILQGKVKSVYNVPDDAEKVLIKFHDKVTAWNGKAVEYPPEKGKSVVLSLHFCLSC